MANCRTELETDGRGRQRTVSKSVNNRGYEVTTVGGRKSTMMMEIRRKETRPRRKGRGGLQLELCYRIQTLTLNGGTSGVHWRIRGCQRAVSCLCTSKCKRMSKYTLILTNQLMPPSQPMPMIMLSKAKWRSPDGFRWGGCSPRRYCDSGRKVKVAEKNYVDYSVGGEGRRTTLGSSVPGASAEDV